MFRSIQTCRHVLGMSGEPILITCRENHAFKLFEYLKKDIKTDSISIKQQLDLDRVVVKNDPLNDGMYLQSKMK